MSHISSARQSNEPYLKWVEGQAVHPGMAFIVHLELRERLYGTGFQGDISKPDHQDLEHIYLLKAAVSYLKDCLCHHEGQEIGYDPQKGIAQWLSTSGRLWMINDALTQTLTKALNHSYCHAAAKAEGREQLSDREMIAHVLRL